MRGVTHVARDIVGDGNPHAPATMREFFYVDLQRVRSYYAQANRGIIESIITKDAQNLAGDLKASIFGIGTSGSLARNTSHDETRSLQEITYALFEELLYERNLITDLDASVVDTSAWLDGLVHGSLREGQIIRFTGDITVLDPEFFSNRLSQFLDFMSAFAGTQIGDLPGGVAAPPSRQGGATRPGKKATTPDEEREQAKRELISTLLQGLSTSQVKDFANLFSAFSHRTISMRVFPCGVEHPEFHFSGSLLSRTDYMQAEREELYGRYSNELSGWTAVMQVARIPVEVFEAPNLDGPLNLMTDDERIDRVAVEQIFRRFSEFFEHLGLAQGAAFPAISVTPLALYREFE
jgi:hypothetical protein